MHVPLRLSAVSGQAQRAVTGRPSWWKMCSSVVRLATAFHGGVFFWTPRLSTSGLKGENAGECEVEEGAKEEGGGLVYIYIGFG